MLEKDRVIIDAQTEDTLATWWCLMNSGGWPDELPDKPKDRRKLAARGDDERSWGILYYIQGKIGNKRISWEWNKERMTPEYFEEWYTLTYENRLLDEERWVLLEELDKKYNRKF